MTANDRFKRSFASRVWAGLILATVGHMALFAFWPTLTAQSFGIDSGEIQILELPSEIELPPPPEEIPAPKAPVVTTAAIDEDITIPTTVWSDHPANTLPPPPDSTISRGIGDTPRFTPMTVAPGIKNRAEVQAALTREYPPLLRDAGIGGTVVVWFQIDETGEVTQTLVRESSGHDGLDQAALKVAEVVQFTPALNREKRVAVWISLPITFTAR